MSLWPCLISITNLVEEINGQILQGISQPSSRHSHSQDLQGLRMVLQTTERECINEMKIIFHLLNEPAISGVLGDEAVKLLWLGCKKQVSSYGLCWCMGVKHIRHVKLKILWMAWSKHYWKSVERMLVSDPKTVSQQLRFLGLFFTQ